MCFMVRLLLVCQIRELAILELTVFKPVLHICNLQLSFAEDCYDNYACSLHCISALNRRYLMW